MHGMPNENDERYTSTFETFSTQGYIAVDKFDLDVMRGYFWSSRKSSVAENKSTSIDVAGNSVANKEFEEPAHSVDIVSDNYSVMRYGVTGY